MPIIIILLINYIINARYIIIIRLKKCLLKKFDKEQLAVTGLLSGFGGLEVACWPLVPKVAGSNPAEAVGFFRAKKSSARLPSEGK